VTCAQARGALIRRPPPATVCRVKNPGVVRRVAGYQYGSLWSKPAAIRSDGTVLLCWAGGGAQRSQGKWPQLKGLAPGLSRGLESQTPRLRRSGSRTLSRGACGSLELTLQSKLRPSTVAISSSRSETSLSVHSRRRLTSQCRREELQCAQACLRTPVLSRPSARRHGPLHITLQ